MTDPVVIDVGQHATEFWAALELGRHVLVHDRDHPVDDEVLRRLLDAVELPGVASASPVPVLGVRTPSAYPTHASAPPPASLPLPCPTLTVLSAGALASVPAKPHRALTVPDAVGRLGERLGAHGWRHVAVPGIAHRWDPASAHPCESTGGWTTAAIASAAGPANTGLEAHVSWARASLHGVTVVVDGACLTAEPGTGTQHLVLEISRWLATTRPDDKVKLAVRADAVDAVRQQLSDSGVDVVERSKAVDGDVSYRPYQMLTTRELGGVLDVGRRTVVGQLDMIGFSNFAYHPSDDLAFFARNLQRYLMRRADAVTFISEFGRTSAFVECPDLDEHRLHVVSCGADPTPQEGRPIDLPGVPDDEPWVACLASTFWHKNRPHAIATFAELVERHAYDGHLLIAGPEPYYGRSLPAEDALIAELPARIAARIHRVGHVGDAEKWWLLRNADAVLYPSVVEGFGLVPFEAAAVGTPCLAFAGTAQGELLAGTGAVIDSWDVPSWADRIGEWIRHAQRGAIVVSEVEEVATRHTWRTCAERTWTAFDDALARPRRWVHPEEGTFLTRVAPGDQPSVVTDVRFDVARGIPAVGRRVRRAFRQVKDATSR